MMEWESSVWGEGHTWDMCLGLCGQQRTSAWEPLLSSWVIFLLRVQPGVDLGRQGGKRAQSLLPLPGSPSCACDSHGNAKGTKISLSFLCCSKAAVVGRVIFDLCTFSSFLSVRHILFGRFSFREVAFTVFLWFSCFASATSTSFMSK